MKILSTEDTKRVMSGHPELRVSDIPPEGMVIDDCFILSASPEGEVTVFHPDPYED